MALSENKKNEYIKRLLMSRMRILVNNGFYGLLLMHMKFAIDEKCETAATDGIRIYFGPQFLDELSDSELDFVMMHEILHVVLQHCLREGERDKKRYNIACDIVVNSNILLSENMNVDAITLRKWGEAMHKTPDGKEGYGYTVEQVYNMLPVVIEDGMHLDTDDTSDVSGKDKPSKKKQNDTKTIWDDRTKKGSTEEEKDEKEKHEGTWDDHTKWGSLEDDGTLKDVWVKRFQDVCEAISVREASGLRGLIPMFAERLLKELRTPQTNWRMLLNEFVQEEIADYSFTPPDRRFDDGPFFLPDFNDKQDVVKDILFMIDTSASMSDDMITAAYSEIKGAIDQYDGKLQGWLGFFDAAIIEPKPFSDEDEFKVIKPVGGGGTSFQIIFEYVNKYMVEKLPASIVILTDGYAPFPPENETNGIPVLWLLNNDIVNPTWGKVARITIEV